MCVCMYVCDSAFLCEFMVGVVCICVCVYMCCVCVRIHVCVCVYVCALYTHVC